MGVAMATGSGLLIDLSCPGVVVAGVTAKSMTAARSFLSQAKRNTTFLCLPDCRVDGAAPAREVSDSASGNRARQSPISASAAARTRPDRGRG